MAASGRSRWTEIPGFAQQHVCKPLPAIVAPSHIRKAHAASSQAAASLQRVGTLACFFVVREHEWGTKRTACWLRAKPKLTHPGAPGWLAPVERLTLDFGSGHDLSVPEIEPRVRLFGFKG